MGGGDGEENCREKAQRGQCGGTENPKPETRNPKQIRIHGNERMEKKGATKFLRRLRAFSTVAVPKSGAAIGEDGG